MSKPVFVPLATEPFANFAMGAKTVEIRNLDSPVARQVIKDTSHGRPVNLSHGYGTKNRLAGQLGRVEAVASAGHFSEWVRAGAALDFTTDSPFFNGSGQLLAFEVLPRFNLEVEG